MRLATWNIEWFSNLFDEKNRPLRDGEWSARHNVTRRMQIEGIAHVLRALDADAIMIIEAPDQSGQRDTVLALERFAKLFGLRTSKAVMGFANDTQQEIALLFDPEKLNAHHDPQGEATGRKGKPDAPRFDGVFRIDLDFDATEDLVTFSKPPLELACETHDGIAFRLIGAHLKSKAPHGARNRDEVMRLGILNRRKQLAQAIWLRGRIDQHLKENARLIVMGDLNDGPGLDEYEALFGRSSVEIIMGLAGPMGLFDPHARQALQRRLGASPTTARFFIPAEPPAEGSFLQALLDYIMISEDLMARNPRWRIWHPFDNITCWADEALREALINASDHFPVTMDLELGS